MSSPTLATIVVTSATIGLQLLLTRWSGRRPSLTASFIFACYFAGVALALRWWPIPTLIVLAACAAVMAWLARDALLAGRDIETADHLEEVGRR